MIPGELFARLIEVLETIAAVVTGERARYDNDPILRFAVQRLWISAGNYAEEFRKGAGRAASDEPWAELYGYRSYLAHALDEEMSDGRVWRESTEDLPRLLQAVRSLT